MQIGREEKGQRSCVLRAEEGSASAVVRGTKEREGRWEDESSARGVRLLDKEENLGLGSVKVSSGRDTSPENLFQAFRIES